MLAERLPSAEKILQKIGECAAEAKLNGFRCQVQVKGKNVEIFSRNPERMIDMFPSSWGPCASSSMRGTPSSMGRRWPSTSRPGILQKALFADGCQGINALPEIDRLDGEQDPELRDELDHCRWRKNRQSPLTRTASPWRAA